GNRRTPPERRRCAGAHDIFALRFAQQPIGLARLARQPRRIGLSVVPVDADRRMSAALRKAGIAPRTAGALVPFVCLVGFAFRASIMARLSDKGCELVERHGELAGRELPRERDAALRAFLRVPLRLILRRAHHERAHRYHHHLWTSVAFLEAILRLE